MGATKEDPVPYVLGHSDEEIQRLERQGQYLRAMTRDLLVRAGVGPGMRVLDYGAGAGDVALLAAELVGPTGEVVAIDRSPDVLARARIRSAARGVGHVSFVHGDEQSLASIAGGRLFDAVVGRLVLIHQRDLVGALRAVTSHVRPGGIVAFHEIDIEGGHWASTALPLFEQAVGWITNTFARAGASTDMGRSMSRAFDEVGIRSKRIVREGMLEDGSDPAAHRWLGEVLRTMLPAAEKMGVATAAEVQIDTLSERLDAEAKAAGAHWVPTYLVSAWGRVAETPTA